MIKFLLAALWQQALILGFRQKEKRRELQEKAEAAKLLAGKKRLADEKLVVCFIQL